MIGVLIGVGLAVTISKILRGPALVSSLSMVVSFAFPASVAIFLGYYPMHKAASLDPMEALSYV